MAPTIRTGRRPGRQGRRARPSGGAGRRPTTGQSPGWDALGDAFPLEDLTPATTGPGRIPMSFRVELDLFRGPLDLLLYLVRRQELEVTEIALAQVTEQFLVHLEVLAQLDFDLVGDFLEVASTLIEMKAASLLPTADAQEPILEDGHENLVQRLLEYKQYKDAASMLEEQGRTWQQCYGRLANDAPQGRADLADQPLHEVEVWDLVSAFGRIIRESKLVEEPPSIVYDETPLHVYMQRIHDRLVRSPRIAFHAIFEKGLHKSALIGIFLALLELVRHHDVLVEQPDLYGEIWIARGEQFQPQLSWRLTEADRENSEAPTRPR